MSQKEKSPQENRAEAYAGIILTSLFLLIFLGAAFSIRMPGWIVILTCVTLIGSIISFICKLNKCE